MTRTTKIILFILAAIAPIIALKLMGRPIVIETKLELKAEKQTGNCVPFEVRSLVDEQLFIIEPSMGFALSNQGILQQMGRIDMVFTDHPEGRIDLPPRSNVKTCLRFRSAEKLEDTQLKASGRTPDFLLQCKLGVRMGAPDKNFTRVYAIVFPCTRYLEGFEPNPPVNETTG